MNCQRCRTEIEELLLDEPLSERAALHLSQCPPCRAFHDERRSLKRLVASLSPVSAPQDFDFRLRARLASAGNGKNPRLSWRTFITSAPAISLAASFALIVAGIIFYNQFRSGGKTENRTVELARQEPTGKPEATNSISTATPKEAMPQVEQSNQTGPEIVATGARIPPAPSTAANKNIRHQPRRFETNGAPIQSNDMADRGAPQIKLGGNSPLIANKGQLVELPVRSSAQPVKVQINDSNGGKRTVSLQPVILGSQDLTGRTDARLPSSSGIW